MFSHKKFEKALVLLCFRLKMLKKPLVLLCVRSKVLKKHWFYRSGNGNRWKNSGFTVPGQPGNGAKPRIRGLGFPYSFWRSYEEPLQTSCLGKNYPKLASDSSGTLKIGFSVKFYIYIYIYIYIFDGARSLGGRWSLEIAVRRFFHGHL